MKRADLLEEPHVFKNPMKKMMMVGMRKKMKMKMMMMKMKKQGLQLISSRHG